MKIKKTLCYIFQLTLCSLIPLLPYNLTSFTFIIKVILQLSLWIASIHRTPKNKRSVLCIDPQPSAYSCMLRLVIDRGLGSLSLQPTLRMCPKPRTTQATTHLSANPDHKPLFGVALLGVQH